MELRKCKVCESVTVNVDEKTETCEVCLYRVPLLQILTLIHEDPDEKYIDVAGIQKATNDAMVKYIFLLERDKV
jgi:hypothetical protein